MKAQLLLHFIILFAILPQGYSQTFEIGHTTITFVDASRGNRNVETEIYYPADAAGDNVAVTAIQSPFPVLAFGHGFVMAFSAYENIWTNIVPKGFIMAFPKTEGNTFPSHLEFAKDLAFVINQLELEGQNPTSLFYNRIAAMSAVMGHSMGGGAAFLAATLDPGINAIAVLAPAETNPSSIAAAGLLQIQSLIFAGSNDCVTPPAANQIPMYDALGSNCKTYISITGGSHCQMADSNFLCNFGEVTCSPAPTITRNEQHAVINNYLGNWLDATLKANCTAGTSFDQQLVSDNSITFQKNCMMCEPLSSTELIEANISVYPNPFNGQILVTGIGAQELSITIYDYVKTVVEKLFIQNTVINLDELSSGIYFYTISSEGKIIKRGKLIKQ